ncbi:CbtB domain-containing protein [Streptomyces sp. NPDC056909]|uniref:CbtB domain-containing protein n=1 Tax=unclassified Streptomyces TaxID=2593676 RepID=UPI0034280826|nr:CbtB-domain containing protein [Streptomyces sp. NBC_00872]
MAESIAPPTVSPVSVTVTPLPLRAVLPWAVFVGTLMLVLLYFVGAEQGATSVFSGEGVHEWVHDGRHLLGFPCH